MKPLMDLLGISPFHVYDEMPVRLQREGEGRLSIRFLMVVDPSREREDWPTTIIGRGTSCEELAYEVRIPLTGDFKAEDLWDLRWRPEGTREAHA